jgi:hypothetical protein
MTVPVNMTTIIVVCITALLSTALPVKANTNSQTSLMTELITEPVSSEIIIAQDTSENSKPSSRRSYIGVGGGIGLSDGETGLSDGGLAILTRIGLTDNISFHNATVFGDNTAVMIALTVGTPIRNADSEQVVAYPFIGGGINLNTSNDFKVDPLLVTGVDIPLSNRFTATGRLNIGFGENKTDVGLLLGVGFSL